MDTVLIYRLGSLGDTVLGLPCFHRIARSFPESRRIVLTNRPVSRAAPHLADILGDSGLIHGTIDYRVGSRSPLELMALWLKLRRLRASTLVYLTAARGLDALSRDLKFMRSCGITKIVGAPTTSDMQANRRDPVSGVEEQECARLTRTLQDLGPIDLEDRANWDLHLTEGELDTARQRLASVAGRPFIAVNMGGKAAQNDWGQGNWERLIGDIGRELPDLRFVFVGAADDAARATNATDSLSERVLNLCGMLRPRETAAVLKHARLFVGHDSGPLHLAASCQVPCVGIYSNLFKPRKWHPFGAQHHIIHPEGPISTVSVSEVRSAVLSAMSVRAAI